MRFIDDGWRTGAENMARDEALSVCAGDGPGVATLRVYRFKPPCVTIGRFQEFPAGLDAAECARMGIEIVRRPTGGLAILHFDDFTYSFTFPSSRPSGERSRVFSAVGEGILASLARLGVKAGFAAHHGRLPVSTPWCFESEFGVDLEWEGRKICGSAQRRAASCVLQHGSLFLRPADVLLACVTGAARAGRTGPGGRGPVSLEEAAGRPVAWEAVREAFAGGFQEAFGEELSVGTLSPLEEGIAERLSEEKYGTLRWLECPGGR